MNDFRELTPIQRPAPLFVNNYRLFKKYLKQDFHSKCGYCNDSDSWTGGWRFSQLDHFVPRKYLVEIHVNEYSNLIYSCFFCNNAKRAKWPTKDEKLHHNDIEGFVYPKSEDYSKHIARDKQGKIVPLTSVGEYMIKEIKLHLKRHAIIWNLEQAQRNFNEALTIFEDKKNLISHELALKIIELSRDYHMYTQLLITENDA